MKKFIVLSVFLILLSPLERLTANIQNQFGISFLQVGASKDQVLREVFNFKVSSKVKVRNAEVLSNISDLRKNKIYKGAISVDTSSFSFVPSKERFLFNPENEYYFIPKMTVSNNVVFLNVSLFFKNNILTYAVMDYQPIIEEILHLKYEEPTGGQLYNNNAEWSNDDGSKISCTKNHIYISLDFYSNQIQKENQHYTIWAKSKIDLLDRKNKIQEIDIENF